MLCSAWTQATWRWRLGEIEPRTLSGRNESRGHQQREHQQNVLTLGLEHGVLKLWRQPELCALQGCGQRHSRKRKRDVGF